MKIMCLILVVDRPGLLGMGFFGSGVGKSCSTSPLFARTGVVHSASCAASGTGTMLTEPIVLCLGEPILSGGKSLVGPAPRPREFATYRRVPSALTRMLLGHQPTGM